MWNWTGETPLRLPDTVSGPITLPSVTSVAATPLASVVTDFGLSVAADAGETDQLTFEPLRGKPSGPRTTKLTGVASVAPVGADWPSPATPVTEPALGPVAESPPHAVPPNIPAIANGTRRDS